MSDVELYGMGWSAPSLYDLELAGSGESGGKHEIDGPEYDHSACQASAELYGQEFCLATRKPGVCVGSHRGPYVRPVTQAPPDAPAAKTAQRLAAEQAAAAGYQAAYLAAQRLADQLGGNQGHSRVVGAMHDYARASHQHDRAVTTADRARTKAQAAHDSAVAQNAATQHANEAAQAAAIAKANLAARHKALHKAARAHPRHRKAAPAPPPGFGVADLYAQANSDPGGFYSQPDIAHWGCDVGEFCRNPLHPGPCKGWKHTLHAVAPGAYHAFERTRVEKANARRKAKIAALQALGKPVPPKLLKEITYAAPGAGQAQPGFTPPTPAQATTVVSNIAGKVKTNVPVRAAQLTDAKLGAQAQSLHDVTVAIQGKTSVSPSLLKSHLAKTRATQAPGDKLTDHPSLQKSIASLAENVGNKKALSDSEVTRLQADITKHVEAGTGGVPQSVKAALALPAPPSASPTGNSPFRIVQARIALKNIGSTPDPRRMAAYDNLTSADLAQMTDADRKGIEDDLFGLMSNGASNPAVANIAARIHGKLFGGPAAAPSPGGGLKPSAPLPAGTAAHVQHAVAVANRTAPGAALSKNHLETYGKLTRAEFDGLPAGAQAIIRADLTTAHGKFLDPKRKAGAQALLDRFAPAGGQAQTVVPARAVTFPELEHLKAQTDPVKIATAFDSAGFRARTPAEKASLEAHRLQVENDATQPAWLRARMYAGSADFRKNLGGSANVMDAVNIATDVPSTSGKWYPLQTNLGDLLKVGPDDTKHLPAHVQEAINSRRGEAVHRLLDTSRSTTLGTIFGNPYDEIDDAKYKRLDIRARRAVDSALRAERDHSTGQMAPYDASRWQMVIDKVDSNTYSSYVSAALKSAHDQYVSHDARIHTYSLLTQAEFKTLPVAHRDLIEEQLDDAIAGASVPITRQLARHTKAEFNGTMPHYSNQKAQDAVLAATVDKDEYSDSARTIAYSLLNKQTYNSLDIGDKQEINQDMDTMANSSGSSLNGAERYHLQIQADHLKGVVRPTVQQDAVDMADPSQRHSEAQRIAAYSQLPALSFALLPDSLQTAIDDDLTRISTTNPSAYARIMAKLHPGWSPPHAPAVPVTKNANPKIQDALDALYGVHPKSSTVAHQLKVYSALRTADFQAIQPHEQSALLGDLSYIATTSKGPNQAKAQKLIDYFTPPGTPAGVIPNQPVNVPANAVSGQSRVADPAGTPGLLKMATNKGMSGDGFTRTTSGGSGPWGKYGAAGVMLRHVDSSGTVRYLMIERGPGISDPGKWQFPGGAIDSLETPHQGAARETIEELGFKSNALDGARVHGEFVYSVPAVRTPSGDWKYTTIAATVPDQIKPDLSTHHARMETSDAKWMTLDEIRKLDKNGRMLTPLAGGKLEQNVVSLFPATAHAPGRPAPVTKKLPRLTGTPGTPKPAQAHKPSRGKDLLSDKTAIDKLRQDVKNARSQYDGKTADGRLAAIGAMQGFDDTPTVATKAEMDRLLASGDYIEVWRGVRGTYGKDAAKINEEMRSGPAYYGKGVFGNGYYLAGKKKVADDYSDGSKNSVIRILIPKAAVIATHEKMAKEASAIASPHSKAKSNRYEDGTLYDQGRYAAARGVDGIRIDPIGYHGQRGMSSTHVSWKGQEAYNWLNRSVLIVQEAQ